MLSLVFNIAATVISSLDKYFSFLNQARFYSKVAKETEVFMNV